MKRLIYQKLINWKEKKFRKPLILRGVRQVGKTYILREFGKQNFPRSHYINFEKDKSVSSIFEDSLDPKKIIQGLNFFLNTSININEDLLIFDEIQECPRALTSLKYFAEEMPQLPLASAGSLLGIHLGPVSFPVGKVDILFLYPMSFKEFLMALEEERSLVYLNEIQNHLSMPEIVHSQLWEYLKWYFTTGGLPEVVKNFCHDKNDLFQAFNKSREIQSQLIISYIADMAKHSGKVNAMHLDRIWKSIPEQLAKSQDAAVKRFIFKDIVPGINRYDRLAGAIDWLDAAGLTIKVPIANSGLLPFSAHTKDNFFKMFLFDVGILGALSGLQPKTILDYDYGSYKGYFAENFVAQEFLSRGVNLFSWQEKTSEVEFLLDIEGKPIPVEVKSGWVTNAKSLHIFANKYNSPFRIIFSAHNTKIDEKSSIHRYPLYLAGQLPIQI